MQAGLRLSPEQKAECAVFIRSLEESTEEGRRDGFISIQKLKWDGYAVIAEARRGR